MTAPEPSLGPAPAPERPGPVTRAQISALVRTAAADVLGAAPEEIDEHTDLERDFGIDSLELMDIGSRLENALRVRIPLADLVEARTVSDAVTVLHDRLAGRR
ncbi:acyl carrier protein [Streptomyces sp. NPDC007088]|uniref:acyl carrier protein n=1 Tax=Streptomyces sp. NPDC007088 TaxID=3364773 RepID=UPI0036772DE7